MTDDEQVVMVQLTINCPNHEDGGIIATTAGQMAHPFTFEHKCECGKVLDFELRARWRNGDE